MYIVILIILLCTPSLMTFTNKAVKHKIDEKKGIISIPKYQNDFLKFLKDYRKYFKNNYFGRDIAIFFYNNIRFLTLKESPVPEKVLLGENNYLFYCDKNDGNSITDYQGFIQLNERELEIIYNRFNNINEWLTKRKIKFYLVIAPDKQTIYYNYLPDKIKKNNKTAAEQIIPYLKSKGIPVIDLKDEILKAKDSYEELYYKTDTHWNKLGAYIGYCGIVKKLKLDFPAIKKVEYDITNIRYTPETHGGDLVHMLGISNYPYHRDVVFQYKKNYVIKSQQGKIIDTQGNINLPKAVIYRDSFTTNLLPLLANHFSYCRFIWKSFDKSEIEEMKPDLVMIIIVERFLKYYL